MEWTDISITVKKADADTAEAIATMIANGGIYIEDYSDLEEQVQAIAHIDLIEQELLEKDRDTVIVHMYLSPEEHPAEILALFQEKLEASGIAYTLSTSGVEQEDWQNGWKKYYHSMEIGRHLAVVPSWETYENTDGRAVLKLDPGTKPPTCAWKRWMNLSRAASACWISAPAAAFWPLPRCCWGQKAPRAWISTPCACAPQAKTPA